MCGRFVMLAPEEVRDVIAAVEDGTAARPLGSDGARRLARPGNPIPTIGRAGGALSAEELLWGFTTSWNNKTVINTRIESALSGSPLWRDAIRDGRRIVPAASFFEPHQTEKARNPQSGKLGKRSYAFADEQGQPLLMACVASGGSCSIVTCEPNRWVAPVHPRMPLLLRFEEVPLWLDGDVGDLTQLADRGGFPLRCNPEHPQQPAEEPGRDFGQLSLF